MSWQRKPLPRTVAAGLALILAAVGCSTPMDKSEDPMRFQSELLQADRDFAREVEAAAPADRGRVWTSWFAPGGRQLLPGQVVEGLPSIAELMSPAFAAPGYSLTWEPDLAQASAAGDLGWTSGRYRSSRSGPGGDRVEHGRYLTIWQRMEDGRWKVALDTGVPDPVP